VKVECTPVLTGAYTPQKILRKLPCCGVNGQLCRTVADLRNQAWATEADHLQAGEAPPEDWRCSCHNRRSMRPQSSRVIRCEYVLALDSSSRDFIGFRKKKHQFVLLRPPCIELIGRNWMSPIGLSNGRFAGIGRSSLEDLIIERV